VVAKVKYTPIGDAISPESTFVQAAIALDVAAQFAVETRNTAELNRTAELWIEMAKALMEIDEESGPPPERDPLGFRQIKTDKESEDDRANPKDSDSPPGEGTSGDDD
jgi:hypothetical protein